MLKNHQIITLNALLKALRPSSSTTSGRSCSAAAPSSPTSASPSSGPSPPSPSGGSSTSTTPTSASSTPSRCSGPRSNRVLLSDNNLDWKIIWEMKYTPGKCPGFIGQFVVESHLQLLQSRRGILVLEHYMPGGILVHYCDPRNIEEQPSGRTSGIIFALVLWSHLKKKNSPEIVVTSSKISVPIHGTWAKRRTALHQISYSMVNKHLKTKFHTEEQPSKCHE